MYGHNPYLKPTRPIFRRKRFRVPNRGTSWRQCDIQAMKPTLLQSSKLQHPSTREIPSSNAQTRSGTPVASGLRLGDWNFSEVWSLAFGVFPSFPPVIPFHDRFYAIRKCLKTRALQLFPFFGL